MNTRTLVHGNGTRDPVMRMWDAIEAVFAASDDVQMTEGAVHGIVEWCAAKAHAVSREQCESAL